MIQVYNPTLKIQELKKLKENNMIESTELIDIKGMSFKMLAMTKEADISPYLPGYILTNDGEILPIVNGDTHLNVADKYIEKYFQRKRKKNEFYLDLLLKTDAVMYIGGRLLEDGSIDTSQKEGFLLLKKAPYLYSEQLLDNLQRLEQGLIEHGMILNYLGPSSSSYESPFGTNFKNKIR